MDHQKSKEHLIFKDGVRKNKAAKARLLRKNVLQVKKTRRLKTMSKENASISCKCSIFLFFFMNMKFAFSLIF
jgi:hypothetical protein